MRPVDPLHPDARHCVRANVAELNHRSDSGYYPSKGVSAKPHELRPPPACSSSPPCTGSRSGVVRCSGATAARLETNGARTEAIGLYRAAGYREVPAFNVRAPLVSRRRFSRRGSIVDGR
jgi:hypothetical protein